MATTAVWVSAVQAIECLLTDRTNAAALYSSAFDTEKLLKASPAPTVWRKLLDDVQVPLRVGKVLSQAAAVDPARNLVVTAVCILARFMECAPGGIAATTPAQKRAAWRQLQQSGAVQVMPRVITAASVTLGGCFKAAISGNLPGVLSCGSIGAFSMAATSMRDPFQLPDHVECSLTLVESWKHLQPEGAAAAAVAPCLAAALQLANTAMRLISTHVQQHLRRQQQQQHDGVGGGGQTQQQQQQLQPPALEPVIPCLNIVNHVWALEQEFLTWQEEEAAAMPAALRRMLQSQSYFTGKALLAVVSTFAGLLSLKKQSAATDIGTSNSSSTSTTTSSSSSTGGTGTSNSSSTTPTNTCCEGACNGSCITSAMAAAVKHSTKSWERSAALLPLLMPCHTKLLELLGVDGRSVAWAAAHVGSTYTLFNAKSSTRSILSGLFSTLHAYSQTFSAAPALRTMPQAQARVVLQLLPLLAATGTHAAAWVQQQQLCVQLTLDVCTSAAQFTSSSLLLYEKGRRQLQLEQQSTSASSAQGLLPLPAVEWLQQMLPRTLQLANKVLQCLYPASDSSAADGGGVESHAAASDSSITGSSTTNNADAAAAAACVGAITHSLVYVVGAAGCITAVGEDGKEEEQQQQPSSEVSDAWTYLEYHLADVAALLEAYLRSTAAAHARGARQDRAEVGRLFWSASKLLRAPHGVLIPAVCQAGPDSAVWKALCSLLRSLTKFTAVIGRDAGEFYMCQRLWSDAMDLLLGLATDLAAGAASSTTATEGAAASTTAFNTGEGVAEGAALPSDGVTASSASSTSASSASSASSAQAHSGVVEAQPVVFLLGCFCLLVVQLHKQRVPAYAAGSVGQHGTVMQGWDTLNLFRLDTKDVMWWLRSPSVAAGLAAAGYQVDYLAGMLQHTEELLAFVKAAVDSQPGGANYDATVSIHFDEATESRLVSAFTKAGSFYTCLATSAFCNNPACENLAGSTEASLVSGASCVCGGCLVARYCSRACQRTHWKQHKPVCKALATAATAAKAAAPAPAAVGGGAGDD